MQRVLIAVVLVTFALGAIGHAILSGRLPSASEAPSTPTSTVSTLTADEAATLSSLEKIDDQPVYVMRYVGAYRESVTASVITGSPGIAHVQGSAEDACSLFAAAGDATAPILGRNFDWYDHPFLLLFSDPPDGYASMSFVNLSYFVSLTLADRIDEAPLEERVSLLATPSSRSTG